MNSYCLPIYFFCVLFTYSKCEVFPFLLLIGIFIDKVYYNFPFYHTIFILFFFFIHSFLKPVRKRSVAVFRTIITTSCYLLILSVLTFHFSFSFFFVQILWNSFFSFLIFDPGKIYIKKHSFLKKSWYNFLGKKVLIYETKRIWNC